MPIFLLRPLNYLIVKNKLWIPKAVNLTLPPSSAITTKNILKFMNKVDSNFGFSSRFIGISNHLRYQQGPISQKCWNNDPLNLLHHSFFPLWTQIVLFNFEGHSLAIYKLIPYHNCYTLVDATLWDGEAATPPWPSFVRLIYKKTSADTNLTLSYLFEFLPDCNISLCCFK